MLELLKDPTFGWFFVGGEIIFFYALFALYHRIPPQKKR